MALKFRSLGQEDVE